MKYRKLAALAVAMTIGGSLALVAAAPANAAPIAEWDFSESRATGHYELVTDGLHVWTEGATSTDKVAGYVAVDVPLDGASASFVDYTATTGITPGAQLVISDGVNSGILVGEAVYGGNWWLSNGSSDAFKAADPSGANNGGNGSDYFGTLAEWGAALPDVSIVYVGFSLGSGVLGDGVVHGVTLNDVTYTFDWPEQPADDVQVDNVVLSSDTETCIDTVQRMERTVPYVFDQETFTWIAGEPSTEWTPVGDEYTEATPGCEVAVVVPPATEEPTPTTKPVVNVTPTGQLAETGSEGQVMLFAAALVIGLGAAFSITGLLIRRRKATK